MFNVIISLLISFSGISQGGMQVFPKAGFKVNCGCKLQVNNLFIDSAKQNNINNIFAAYFCGENPDDAAIGVVNNIKQQFEQHKKKIIHKKEELAVN